MCIRDRTSSVSTLDEANVAFMLLPQQLEKSEKASEKADVYKRQVYDPIDPHYVWKENRNRNYFGPIKADITLAYQISKYRKGDKR